MAYALQSSFTFLLKPLCLQVCLRQRIRKTFYLHDLSLDSYLWNNAALFVHHFARQFNFVIG